MPSEIAIPEPAWATSEAGWGVETAALASAKWQELARLLDNRGVDLREAATAIELYAITYARMRLAEAHVAEHGPMVPAPRTGVPQHNPYLAIANRAAATLMRLDKELQLTPRHGGKPKRRGGGTGVIL
jgi:phage terminase small subunit